MSLSIIYEYEENQIKYCKCRCECGNFINIEKTKLASTNNCGNCPDIKENIHIHNFTVLNKTNGDNWLCECICGRSIEVKEEDLVKGKIKSCGCCKNYRYFNPSIKTLRFKESIYPQKYKNNEHFLRLFYKD